MIDYSKLTLGELLSSNDKMIRRNAISILKQFQKTHEAIVGIPIGDAHNPVRQKAIKLLRKRLSQSYDLQKE